MRFHLRSPKDYGVDRPDMEAPQGVESTGTNRPKQTHPHTTRVRGRTTNTPKRECEVHAARVHYAVSDTTPHARNTNPAPVICRWLIAAGKRPVPFRTRKLSLPALMVLHSGGCGRVSYRRHKNKTNTTKYRTTGKPRTMNGSGLSWFLYGARERRRAHCEAHFEPAID